MAASSASARSQAVLAPAWWAFSDEFRSYVAEGSSWFNVAVLLETLLEAHGAEFTDAIEAESLVSPRFADAVASADLSEMSDMSALERINELQERLRARPWFHE